MSTSRIVSLEISDLVTRVCDMSYGKKNPTIYKSLIFDNPQYSVEDGFISDRGAYAAELKNQLASAGIKRKDVVFVLTSSKVISREILIPELKPELISELIENEREEYFPMDTTDYTFTYHILEKLPETKQLRVLLFAAPEILIKNYQVFAKENDFKVITIDFNGNTIYQYLANAKEKMDMYIQVNEKNSMFTILEKGKLALQRNMNFGAHTLINALNMGGLYGKDLDNVEGLLKLRENDLIYHSFTEMEEACPEDSEEQKLHQTKENLTESARPFISNISRVLEYYNTKNREAKVTTMYIGGVGAKVLGLKELIESEFIGIEVIVADISKTTNFQKKNPVGIERSTEFIGCIGCSVRTINFSKQSAQAKMERTLVFCVIGLILVIVASVAIVLNAKTEYDNAVTNKMKVEIAAAGLDVAGDAELSATYSEAVLHSTEIMSMDDDTFNINERWNDILSYLEQNSISNMELASLNSSETSLTFNVILHSKAEVGQFMLQMQNVPYFKSISTGGISEQTDEEGNISINLSVVCEYNLEWALHKGEEVAE